VYPNIPFEVWPLKDGPPARAVELSPRSRTGSGAGLSLPNALSGERFGGIIRTAKDSLRTETTLSATVS
jgi:hypothetical protein